MKQGRCNNLERCSTAARGTIVNLADTDEFLCPECGSPLAGIARRQQLPAGFVAFLILQVLFFAWIGWRWAFGPSPALAKTSGHVILRLAGSNTVGSSLGPALAEAFLKQLGASDVRTQPGDSPDEKNVSGILPGSSSPALITIAAHGSATAFTSLAEAKCDVGAASRKVKPDEIRTLSFLGDMSSFASEHVLGLDGIAVIVNAANPISSLRVDQVAQAFTGSINDWSELGGRAGSIKVYARDDKSGTYDTFKTLVLGSAPLVATAKRFEDSTQLSNAVAADPYAIGFIGLPYIHSAKALAIASSGTRPLLPNLLTVATEDYPLSRRLYLYTPENSQNKYARPFVEFALSKAGQDVVANTGFVSQNIRLEQSAAPADAPAAYRSLTQDARRLSLDFRFRTGASELDNKALVDLERMATFFSDFRYRTDDLILFGFADNTGVRDRNLQLSLERARKVKQEFERRGLKAAVVQGFGPDLPVASNDTDDGREKNRRVEVWLKGPA